MKYFSLMLCLFCLLFNVISTTAIAGVCALSGSGIGGTGSPIQQHQGSGLGGTGYPIKNNNGSGIGGTGSPLSKKSGSGIGGTGAIANGSGIGGTGQKTDNQASIIIGSITGFGSICVNGIEIHYSNTTPVEINGDSSSTEQLLIGQMVSVAVSGTGNEVIAQQIQVMNIVAGPITEVNLASNSIKVLGQHVQLTRATHIAANNINFAKLQKNDFIQVSGLRQENGHIIADRIDRSIAQDKVHLSGPARHVSPQGFMISGIRINTSSSHSVKEGDEVSVMGRISANSIIAKNIITTEIADKQHFIVEGYAHINSKENGSIDIKIGSVTIKATEQIKQVLLNMPPSQRIIIDGTMDTEHGSQIEQLFIKDLIVLPDDQTFNPVINKNTVNQLHEKDENHDVQIDNQALETNDDSASSKATELEVLELGKYDEDPVGDSDISPEHESIEETDDHTIELPEIEKTDFDEIEVETHELETPEIKIPEIETPEIEIPEIEIPEIEAPEIEVPEIEVPEIEVPEIEVPEIEVPEIEIPEIEVPEIEVPEIEIPEIEVPEIEVPEIEIPEIEVPEIEIPEIEVPEIEIPEIEVPEIEIPEIEVPEIEIPEIEVPEIEIPEIEVPEIEIPEIEVPDSN